MRRLLLMWSACLCLACGCSLGPVNTRPFSSDPAVRRIDPNNGPFIIVDIHRDDPNTGHAGPTRAIQWKEAKVRSTLDGPRTLVTRYRDLDFRLFSKILVRIRLGNGHKYWARMDTGCPMGLYVNDAVVRDCDLAVFPLGEHTETGCPVGICEVPALHIGQITVTNPFCWYEQRQWEFRVFGQPLHRDRTVLLGLQVLRMFPYVSFDNVRHKAVFGLYDAFEPNDPSEWVSLPFVLEEVRGGARMMVDVFLGERKTHVEFDTGGTKPGLLLRESVWQELGGAVGTTRKHASYQFGWLACRRVVVPELRVGQLILKGRSADVLAQDSPLMQAFEGILSLDYFKRTTVVLDFRKNVIWIRRF